MAIEYTLLLKDKKLSEEVLIKNIKSMGYSCNKIEPISKGVCINLNEEIGLSIFLFDSWNYPYNSWETILPQGIFLSERVLECRMIKDYSALEQRYNFMLKLFFDLMSELNEDAILVSNGDTELCFFRRNRPVLLNNRSGIWNRNCFEDIIVNRDVCYL